MIDPITDRNALNDRNINPADKAAYKMKLAVSKTLLIILLVISTVGAAVFLHLGPAFLGGYELTNVLALLSITPQVLTPLFILFVLSLSQWHLSHEHDEKAWNTNVFGLIATLIAIASVLL